jgi:endonuclease/exonuclease/phosphatase family metal-dependent hydrolase
MVKIAILSQNSVSDVNTTPLTIPDIGNPDIYIEMTQEDKRKLPVMSENFLTNYTNVHNENLLKLTNWSGYNVKIKVFRSNEYTPNNDMFKIIAHGSISVKNKPGFFSRINPLVTKGAVYVKLQIDNNDPIVFVNAHLPMLKERDANGEVTDSLGNDFRTQTFLNILEKLSEDNIINNNTTLFFGGDLNFRITRDGSDQLTNLLKDRSNQLGIKELDFVNKEHKRFTCKFQNFTSANSCRNSSVPDNVDSGEKLNNEDFEAMRSIQNDCGVPDRLPSRCDRFLVKPGLNSSITTIIHKGEFFPEIQSDHNTLYAVINYENNYSNVRTDKTTLNPMFMTGGNGYGFDGKEIKSGVMEFSSYKSGGSKKQRRKLSKRKRGPQKRRRSTNKRR